jgi:hypothetical protein
LCVSWQAALASFRASIAKAEADWESAKQLVQGTAGLNQLMRAKNKCRALSASWADAPPEHATSGTPAGFSLEQLSMLGEGIARSMAQHVSAALPKAPAATLPPTEQPKDQVEQIAARVADQIGQKLAVVPQPGHVLPPGMMNVRMEEQVDLLSDKKALVAEVALRKEMASKAASDAERRDNKKDAATEALANIAGRDPMDQVRSIFGLLKEMHGATAAAPALGALTHAQTAVPAITNAPAPAVPAITYAPAPPPPPPPPPPPAKPALPPGWTEVQSPAGTYYHQQDTGVTQ